MSKLTIIPVLCRAGSMDNYSWLLIDEETKQSAVVDPSEAAPIIKKCQELNITPNYIFNTHHHYDHTDANMELKNLFNAKVVGCSADERRIPGIDITLNDNDTFNLGNSTAHIIRVDGHTIGHILWYFPQSQALFTGDTLFNLCIGGLFEGTAQQMFDSLQKIKALPDNVNFYPGHEYTLHGVQFAQYVTPNNPILKKYIEDAVQKISQNHPVSPVTLGIEKQCNPYLLAETLNDFYNLYNA